MVLVFLIIPHLIALGLLILIISVLYQFRDVASWHRTECKKDCWNWSCSFVVPVLAGKFFIAHKYCKSTFFDYWCRKTRTFTLLDDKMSLTCFDFWWNFEPNISSVNRDFLFDWVNFMVTWFPVANSSFLFYNSVAMWTLKIGIDNAMEYLINFSLKNNFAKVCIFYTSFIDWGTCSFGHFLICYSPALQKTCI